MTDLLHSTFEDVLCSATPHTPIGGGGGAAGALHLLYLAPLHLFKWSNTANGWQLRAGNRQREDAPKDAGRPNIFLGGKCAPNHLSS
jgi:hypothetical protein